MINPYQLVGKKILVTGASTGIGRSICINTSVQMADVILTSRNLEGMAKTMELMNPGNHAIVPADLALELHIHNLVAGLPQLDGIIFNAAAIHTIPVKFIKKAILEDLFQINFHSSVLMIQQILKMKKMNNGGSIVFISSLASNYMHLGNSIYSATKGAVNSFAKSLALELAPKQIRVNAILPGMIETNQLKDSTISVEQIAEHIKNYPLGRFGTPQDVAHLAVFLLSDASSWMTGSLLTLDGGYSLK